MNLLLRFPDQSASFTYGVEFGRLLEKIQRGDESIHNNGFPIRIENQTLLKETCIQYGYIPVFSEPYLDGWIDFLGVKNTLNQN